MVGSDNPSAQYRAPSFSDFVVRRLEQMKGFGRVVVGSIAGSLLGAAHAEWIKTRRTSPPGLSQAAPATP